MKKYPQPSKGNKFQGVNTTQQSINYGRQNIMGSLQTMGEQDSYAHLNTNAHMNKEARSLLQESQALYQPAKYAKALQYKKQRSYLKKNGDTYMELDLFCDTQELKYFGLGPYFYVELFRRTMWLLLAMSIIQAITIIINLKGDGLSSYESAFSTYLIKTTVGNYSGSSGTSLTSYDLLLIVGLPAINFLALFIFNIIWRVHIRRTINKQEEDNNDVKPPKFCIQFQGFDPSEGDEEELRRFFSNFGPVYQTSFVKNHQNKLEIFESIDEAEEEIKAEELQIVFGSGSQEKVKQLKQQKQKLQKQVSTLNIVQTTMSAYVHFQFQKTKKQCLQQFKSHYLYSKCSHAFCRNLCCCCIPKEKQKVTYKDKLLFVKSQKVPIPEDINWEHFQISSCNRVFRVCFAFFIIILFLIFSCCTIALCSLYIESHSGGCEGLNISSYSAVTALATNDATIIKCYCGAHLIDSFSDSTIKTACGDYLTGLYIEQSIQYVVIIVSTIMNILFGMIVDRLIDFIRPPSEDARLSAKVLIYTIFLVVNTIFVPILIYGNIFGFEASNYVSLITLISSGAANFFQVQNISFYPSFTTSWYRNVSPIFSNYMVIDTLFVWLYFLLDKCYYSNHSSLQNKEGKMLQKNMNRQITSYKLDMCKQTPQLYLTLVIVFMFFTGMPILLPLGFVNVWSRYIANRNLLQKNSVRIDGLGEQFINFSLTVITICLIAFPLVGQWMLIGNSQVASTAATFFQSISSNYSFGQYIIAQELYLPMYIAISLLTVLQRIISLTVVQFCTCICSCCASPEPNYHSRPFGEYSKGMNVLCSYSIRKNDKMKDIILNLQKYLSHKPQV